MKLYNAKRNTMIRVLDTSVRVPPAGREHIDGTIYKFSHCDGMYSYCKDEQGNVVHLPAWTEVEYVTE